MTVLYGSIPEGWRPRSSSLSSQDNEIDGHAENNSMINRLRSGLSRLINKGRKTLAFLGELVSSLLNKIYPFKGRCRFPEGSFEADEMQNWRNLYKELKSSAIQGQLKKIGKNKEVNHLADQMNTNMLKIEEVGASSKEITFFPVLEKDIMESCQIFFKIMLKQIKRGSIEDSVLVQTDLFINVFYKLNQAIKNKDFSLIKSYSMAMWCQLTLAVYNNEDDDSFMKNQILYHLFEKLVVLHANDGNKCTEVLECNRVIDVLDSWTENCYLWNRDKPAWDNEMCKELREKTLCKIPKNISVQMMLAKLVIKNIIDIDCFGSNQNGDTFKTALEKWQLFTEDMGEISLSEENRMERLQILLEPYVDINTGEWSL